MVKLLNMRGLRFLVQLILVLEPSPLRFIAEGEWVEVLPVAGLIVGSERDPVGLVHGPLEPGTDVLGIVRIGRGVAIVLDQAAVDRQRDVRQQSLRNGADAGQGDLVAWEWLAAETWNAGAGIVDRISSREVAAALRGTRQGGGSVVGVPRQSAVVVHGEIQDLAGIE